MDEEVYPSEYRSPSQGLLHTPTLGQRNHIKTSQVFSGEGFSETPLPQVSVLCAIASNTALHMTHAPLQLVLSCSGRARQLGLEKQDFGAFVGRALVYPTRLPRLWLFSLPPCHQKTETPEGVIQRHLLDVYGAGPYGSGVGTEASSGLSGMWLAVTVAMNWFWRRPLGPTVCLSLLSSRVFKDELCLGELTPGTSIMIAVFKPWWSGDISLEPEKQQSEVTSSCSPFSHTSATPMANFSIDYLSTSLCS